MKDILQQIQNLKEDFMNLIEVEGLGQPASDVPPSTNKIKRDRKTKNGKVELVSVEDELFPYDGNKREQYRQKILDTINGMIQGTATLEDLLQIVRQKKMPVKEAMEVLENLYTSAARMKVNANSKGDFKKYELANKAIRTLNIKGDPQDKYLEDVKRRQGKKEANAQEDRALGDDTKFMKGFYKTRDKQEHVVDTGSPFLRNYGYPDNAVEKSIKRNKKKEQKKAPLEEALQLLESIISEAKPKDPEGYKKNIDIANHYDHLYSISPAKAPDGSPNSVAAEWNRRYQHYFNKAMKCYYGDGSKKKDSIKGALSLIESIHTAIEKGAHEIKKPMLHTKAIMNYSNELQNAAKKELSKDKKDSLKAINDKMNEIAKKRGISPADDYVNGNKPEEA